MAVQICMSARGHGQLAAAIHIVMRDGDGFGGAASSTYSSQSVVTRLDLTTCCCT